MWLARRHTSALKPSRPPPCPLPLPPPLCTAGVCRPRACIRAHRWRRLQVPEGCMRPTVHPDWCAPAIAMHWGKGALRSIAATLQIHPTSDTKGSSRSEFSLLQATAATWKGCTSSSSTRSRRTPTAPTPRCTRHAQSGPLSRVTCSPRQHAPSSPRQYALHEHPAPLRLPQPCATQAAPPPCVALTWPPTLHCKSPIAAARLPAHPG